ncbi:Catenin-beta-like protein [Cunninghamella echinulata]|nr:Catenin-beta-like protein [Cunninghamella echinulata]
MNIDEIFKIPTIPSGRNKRKMPAMPDVDFLEKYQSKGEISSNIEDQSNGKRRLLDNSDNNIDESFQPEADDQFIWNDNDEEGRFFGGGLTDEQSKLLDLVEQFEDDEEENGINAASVKRMILKFEKAINKNQELRMRYADDPTKFMDSEADLDEEIKNLLVLTQAPHLYEELVKLNSVASLVSLLSHENTDISIDAIDLINELLDEDVGVLVTGEGDNDNDVEQRSEEAEKGIKILMESLVK